MTFPNTGSSLTWFHSSLPSNTFCTHASSALMAKIGSCKLENGYCYFIDNYQSKLKVNTKTDCRVGNKTVRHSLKKTVRHQYSMVINALEACVQNVLLGSEE
jgi:hypothetical protein